MESGCWGWFEPMGWEVFGVEMWVVLQLVARGFVMFVKGWVVERVLSWLSGVCRLCRADGVRVVGIV
jgi:hypothetical protein